MLERATGHVLRRLPRARGRIAQRLYSRSHALVPFTDCNGHRRIADLSDTMERLLFAGAADVLPARVMERVVPGSWTIDAGANIGTISGQMAHRAGTVWAFEPLPRNVAKLAAVISENDLGNIRVGAFALGASEATAQLRTQEGSSGWASFSASWIDDGTVDVRVRRLDDVAREWGEPGPLTLVKVDTEGHEAAVLEGAAGLLERHRPALWVEFNTTILTDAGSSGAALLRTCFDLGYLPDVGQDDAVVRLQDPLAGAVDLLLVHRP